LSEEKATTVGKVIFFSLESFIL